MLTDGRAKFKRFLIRQIPCRVQDGSNDVMRAGRRADAKEGGVNEDERSPFYLTESERVA